LKYYLQIPHLLFKTKLRLK